MSESPNVLIVDDDQEAAEDYARLIRQRTGLSAQFTDNPSDAAEIISHGGVGVVVLDQQMPQMVGTDLFQLIRGLDPRIRAILLTGEATREEVAEAQNIGFEKTLFKAQALAQLASAVRHEFVEYQNGLLLDVTATQPVLLKRRHGLVKGSTISYRFAALEIVNENYVPDSDWEEVSAVQVGESRRVKLTQTDSWSLQLEEETASRLSATFGLNAKATASLSSQLQSEVTSRLKKTTSASVTAGIELEQTIQLPPEPADVNQVHVRLRRVQQAPVYIEARIELMADCGCCGRPNLVPVRALVRTNAIALRHIDRMSDGTSREIDLGQTGRS